MRYYERDQVGRRQHDQLLKETLGVTLRVFREYQTPTFTELGIDVQVIEGMVCGLAETLTEFNGVFDNPDLNKAVSTILETVGEHKLALYEDEPPSDLATFPQLVDNCINALRAAEVHATETEDANQLYELLFAVGASKDWVSGTVDYGRVVRMQDLLQRHLEKMYANDELDEYYVQKLVKGIMETSSSSALYAQVETVIGWLDFDEK